MTDDEIINFFLSRSKRLTPKRTALISGKRPANPTTGKKGNPYRFVRVGKREDIKTVEKSIRSSWESNILRILEAFNIPFEYEEHTFDFPLQQRSTRFYIPDIHLLSTKDKSASWLEIKGRIGTIGTAAHGATKIKRFKRYYPEEFENFAMIIGDSKDLQLFCENLEVPIVMLYKDVVRLFKPLIKNWE